MAGAGKRKGAWRDLSEEVHRAVFGFLRGYEAALAALAAPSLGHLLADCPLWTAFAQREYGIRADDSSASHPRHVYRIVRRRELCRTLRWARVPCQHELGMRAGSVVFCRRGHLFALGGKDHRPQNDLHAGVLMVPLVLRRLQVQGAAPPPACNATVTVLEEEAGGEDGEGPEGPFSVLVAGGYAREDRQGESDHFGILRIVVQPDGCIHSSWASVGRMLGPRAGHSATFVPPRIAGPSFPEGYVLLVGGTQHGLAVCSVDLLDVASLAWQRTAPRIRSISPSKRCFHSATLLPAPGLGDAVLVAGGADGDRLGHGPELRDAFWLGGLEEARLSWTIASDGAWAPCPGRGHVAVRLGGTGTALLLGAQPPALAFVAGRPRAGRAAGRGGPEARRHAGCCGLPDGTVLLFGGRSLGGRMLDDVWVAHAGGKTGFFSRVQRELSFLNKMQRRVNHLRQVADSSEEEYPEALAPEDAGAGAALVRDLEADLLGSPAGSGEEEDVLRSSSEDSEDVCQECSL